MPYPPFELECSMCRHRWATRAAPGASIKCPACVKRGTLHTQRVPSARPRTASQARAAVAAVADADDDGLAEAWAAEAPALGWRDMLGAEAGQDCGQCGRPMRWTGAHTAITCPHHERPAWHVSPGVRERSAAYAAALDKRADRDAATIADPGAERARRAETDRASIQLNKRKGATLRQLAALADSPRLHPDDLPTVQWFAEQVKAAATGERLDELADLSGEYDIRPRHWWQARPEPEPLDGWDDDQADDDYPEPGDDTAGSQRARRPATVPGYVAPDPNWRRDRALAAYYDGLARLDGRLPAVPGPNPFARWDAAATARARMLGLVPRAVNGTRQEAAP